MTRNDLFAQLTVGLNADLVDYGELKKLLAGQFDAALQHQSARLGELAEAITGLAERIEARRRQRVALVNALLVDDYAPSMDKVLALLPDAPRRMLAGWWGELESLVRECKTLNTRSCQLLMDQHEIMQRVLNGEADIYAPA
ncbi:MAG TPA: flagellar protein FlgN [Azonexus sp.]